MNDIEPFDHFGIDVSIDDISSASADDLNRVTDLWRAHGLVRIRSQVVTDDELAAFGRRFSQGTLSTTVDVRRSGRPPDRIGWHAPGGSWPVATVILVRRAPLTGLTMEFASTSRALERLDSASRALLDGLSIRHGIASSPTPMVTRDAISGGSTLLLDPSASFTISGVNGVDVDVLCSTLVDHTTGADHVQTLRLEAGDVIVVSSRAVWVNESTSALPEERVLVRVAVGADQPVEATADPARSLSLAERAGATIAGGILAAAMTGIAEVLDPERVRHDIEIVSEAPEPEPLTDLDFGDLPPLD